MQPLTDKTLTLSEQISDKTKFSLGENGVYLPEWISPR